MPKASTKSLKTTKNAELLSYIINSDPVLRAELPLPKQGDSIAPYGKLISSNERYRNRFINAVNLIGLTIIKRNGWDNPWEWFTDRGELRFGQQIREMINDLVKANKYNDITNDETRFLKNQVPNTLEYIHELNFQVFYETSTSDNQFAMAFETEGEGSLFDYISDCIEMLFESWKYDKYIVNKYMLCRRIVDGTITSVEIDNYASLDARKRVSAMKSIANKISFRSPNYNPAGIRKATNFEDQIFILNTDFEAALSTEVLATSYFRNDAEFKSNLAMVDGFGNHDTERLKEVLGDDFIEFTETELAALANVPAVIISKEWFMNYSWAFDTASAETKETSFFNPTTLTDNHFLHVWAVFSTSPFENAAVFTQDVTPAVSTVTVSPSTATMSPGTSLQLSATVATTGFANKAVTWSTEEDDVNLDAYGKLEIPISYTGASELTVVATSVYDDTKTGSATITVV